MVTTDDDALADEVRVLRNQGMRGRYRHERPGFNWRLTEMQAALGRAQLPHYGELVERRRRNAAALTEGLANVTGLVTPREMPGRGHVWHLYTVRDHQRGATHPRRARNKRSHRTGSNPPSTTRCAAGHRCIRGSRVHRACGRSRVASAGERGPGSAGSPVADGSRRTTRRRPRSGPPHVISPEAGGDGGGRSAAAAGVAAAGAGVAAAGAHHLHAALHAQRRIARPR